LLPNCVNVTFFMLIFYIISVFLTYSSRVKLTQKNLGRLFGTHVKFNINFPIAYEIIIKINNKSGNFIKN